MKKQRLMKLPAPWLRQLVMPDPPALPANWSVFVEILRQRRYSSGDVDACVGVSRKVLRDWVRAGILSQLYHGVGSGKGDERFGRWRLFSILDIWVLAYFKRLRDEGIFIERLRQMKQRVEDELSEFEAVQWWFYQALPCWLHRHPFWVHTDMKGNLGYTAIERKNPAIYLVRIAHIEPQSSDLFLTVNLIPLMDKVFALSGPVKWRVEKEDGIKIQIEGKDLVLEPLRRGR